MGIEVKHIKKKFNGTVILDDVSLNVEAGELMALLGPSGSGKTSLLRIIAGLELADSGVVLLEGEEAQLKPVQKRNVGFVFQHYALFKHMTVMQNAMFGLKVLSRKKRPSSSAVKKKIYTLIELMHLEGLENHYPWQLSGGQQQRVALVRALAVDPKVLLLDEPFGALDAKVRKELCRWIRKLHDEIKISSIFVTHDQEEAFEVADRVGIMHQGKILQVDTAERIWNHPANEFVFAFLGQQNIFKGWIDAEENIYLREPLNRDTKPIKFYARPYEMQLTKNRSKEDAINVKITHVNSTGSLVHIEAEDDEKQLFLIEMAHDEYDPLKLKVGEEMFLHAKKIYHF